MPAKLGTIALCGGYSLLYARFRGLGVDRFVAGIKK
jgi:hypothetical protein